MVLHGEAFLNLCIVCHMQQLFCNTVPEVVIGLMVLPNLRYKQYGWNRKEMFRNCHSHKHLD